jgi:hypothetical protein
MSDLRVCNCRVFFFALAEEKKKITKNKSLRGSYKDRSCWPDAGARLRLARRNGRSGHAEDVEAALFDQGKRAHKGGSGMMLEPERIIISYFSRLDN